MSSADYDNSCNNSNINNNYNNSHNYSHNYNVNDPSPSYMMPPPTPPPSPPPPPPPPPIGGGAGGGGVAGGTTSTTLNCRTSSTSHSNSNNNNNNNNNSNASNVCRAIGRGRCCRDSCSQRCRGWKIEEPGGPKLWRQMVIGFVSAACVGLIMFSLGSIFISEAVRSRLSITIMLCIMGMVCGAIILVGVVILGKLFISRDLRRPPQPTHACFQTCSVVYTHSQDQISPVFMDPPPAYDTIAYEAHPNISLVDLGRSTTSDTILTTVDIHRGDGRAVILQPPKYSDVATPLPSYEAVTAE
ncbi:uncharacterized protein LOC115215822 [Argonauta hians]